MRQWRSREVEVMMIRAEETQRWVEQEQAVKALEAARDRAEAEAHSAVC